MVDFFFHGCFLYYSIVNQEKSCKFAAVYEHSFLYYEKIDDSYAGHSATVVFVICGALWRYFRGVSARYGAGKDSPGQGKSA